MKSGAAPAVADGVFLRSCLQPLIIPLARADVTDIYINRPGEMWLETIGGTIERHEVSALTEQSLDRLARQVAALSSQAVNRESPLLSARLPDGSRIQIVAPPATRGPMALAIRRQVAPQLVLSDYLSAGAFSTTVAASLSDTPVSGADLQQRIDSGDFGGALSLAVRERQNILISGGTSSGKTTFLNALLREVPAEERLILIEDTPELCVDHENVVGLIAVRGDTGETRVTANDLVAASLRMRPDRIILGELRGNEALAFLRAVNSGHPGSMTTIHADSPEAAVEQLVLLVLQAGPALTRADVRHYVCSTVHLFVQLGNHAGRRIIERIATVS